jgi:spermidine synthase
MRKLILVLFFFSGFPALIYQLTWQRALFGIFGVNMESVTIVVTAFMLGLGIGSIAGGLFSKKSRMHLLPVLASIEISTAAFGFISLQFFEKFAPLFMGLPNLLMGLVILCLLLIPTVLMGATLPILITYLASRSGMVSDSVGHLYFVNTLGAGVACLLASLLLFPFLGMQTSVSVAALINSFIGLGALLIYFRTKKNNVEQISCNRLDQNCASPRLSFYKVLTLSWLSGFISLSYELFFFRIISFSSGGSASAFALTLAIFLIGLASGARIASHFSLSEKKDLFLGNIVLSIVLANVLAFLFLPLLKEISFLGNWMTGIALFLIFLISMFLGIFLPIIMELGVIPDLSVGLRSSQIYMANIVGSAIGSSLTGFVLMDHLSLPDLSALLLIIGMLNALILWRTFFVQRNIPKFHLSAAFTIIFIALLLKDNLNHGVLEALMWKKASSRHQHFVDTVENRSGIITVDTDNIVYGNGMYDGRFNIDLVHDTNLIIRPYILSLYNRSPKNVLMIGFSSGSWAQIIANNPEVTHLTVLEINPGYEQLVRKRREVSSVLTNPKFTLIVDDGRRWLRLHPAQKFDAIIMNTTWNFRANITNLLSTEFLDLIHQHLTSNGTVFYNTTDSARVQRTGCLAFSYGMRISNHMLLSEKPIHLDFQHWKEVLLEYRIDGRPVIDKSSDIDRNYLASLMALEMGGTLYGNDFFESCSHILERSTNRTVITDDNMGSEWRHSLGIE